MLIFTTLYVKYTEQYLEFIEFFSTLELGISRFYIL